MHRTYKKDPRGSRQGTSRAQYNSQIWRKADKQFCKHPEVLDKCWQNLLKWRASVPPNYLREQRNHFSCLPFISVHIRRKTK